MGSVLNTAMGTSATRPGTTSGGTRTPSSCVTRAVHPWSASSQTSAPTKVTQPAASKNSHREMSTKTSAPKSHSSTEPARPLYKPKGNSVASRYKTLLLSPGSNHNSKQGLSQKPQDASDPARKVSSSGTGMGRANESSLTGRANSILFGESPKRAAARHRSPHE